MSKKLLMNNIKKVKYNITYNLTEVTLDNMQETVIENQSYTAIVTPTEYYEITSISIVMNGVDGTEALFDTTTNTINIPSVVGNVEITIVAEEMEETKESVRANLVKLTSEGFVSNWEVNASEGYNYKNVPMTTNTLDSGTVEYKIESNYIATIKSDGTAKWYSLGILGSYANTTTTREAIEMLMYYHNNYLYIFSDYLSDTYNTYVFNVVKNNAYEEGIYRTQNRKITFPNQLRGDTSSNVITDWGDGTRNTSLNHTYSKDGVYTVKTKYCPSASGSSISTSTNITQFLKEVKSLNKNMTSLKYMFYNCKLLTTLDVSNFNNSKVTDMYYMFGGCNSLTTLNVSNFDTSNVTNMYGMFNNCNSLTTLDVSNFDTSKVTDISYMFSGCTNLTTLDLSNFDTSKVTNMSNMFSNCTNLTSVDVSNFNTSKVTNMGYMFNNCNNLTTLDLSNFDTSKVTDMALMFYNCTALTDFKAPKNISANISFSSCTNLTHDSLMSIINNLATVSSKKTLTLGSTLLAKLTSDEIAIATAKNWTVS